MIRRSIPGFPLVVAVLIGLASRDVPAQANPDSVKHRNNCRLASQVVERAVPDAKREWAHGYIRSCKDSQSQAAILGALTRLRTSTDTTALRFATAILMQVRDGAVFSSMLAIAGDNSASVPARVLTFMRFATLRDPYLVAEYEDVILGLGPGRVPAGTCTRRLSHAVSFESGTTPMPADYLHQIVTVARRVRDDPNAPMHVRSAAACLT